MSLYAFLSWLLFAPIAQNDQPVVVHFTAPWCVACQKMKPTVKSLQRDGYDIRIVDVTKNEALAKRYGIQELPASVVVRKGKIVTRQIGFVEPTRFTAFIKKQQPAIKTNTISPVTTISRASLPDSSFQKARVSRWISVNRAGTPSLTQMLPNVTGRQLLKATVRIELRDTTGVSYGSGTIIHVQQGRALVATCGHLFRESQGKQPVGVDVFYPSGVQRVTGHVLIYDSEKVDVALMTIPVEAGINPIELSPGEGLQAGQRVFTAGCNGGARPTLQRSQINSLNRYEGPENIQTAGAPVGGRSGGGLVNQKGELIGICNAADTEEDEGFYVNAKYIRVMMKRLGIEDLLSH